MCVYVCVYVSEWLCVFEWHTVLDILTEPKPISPISCEHANTAKDGRPE